MFLVAYSISNGLAQIIKKSSENMGISEAIMGKSTCDLRKLWKGQKKHFN